MAKMRNGVTCLVNIHLGGVGVLIGACRRLFGGRRCGRGCALLEGGWGLIRRGRIQGSEGGRKEGGWSCERD